MTQVAISKNIRSRNVLGSIFPSGSINPPIRHRQFEVAAKVHLEEVKDILYQQLKSLLGIEDQLFIYGLQRTTNLGQPFTTYYDKSQPIPNFRQPSHTDHVAQQEKFSGSKLWTLLHEWTLKLGPNHLQRLFALTIKKLIQEYVDWAYTGYYHGGTEVHLQFWVENVVAGVMKQVLSTANLSNGLSNSNINQRDLARWTDIALSCLGDLRTRELFDIVVAWNESAKAIDELRIFATNPATRSYLTNNFINVLHTRLLHPGASTIEILHVYISIIRAFRQLDPRGVLLDRVARRVQRYLRDRDDTVKVIVTGLLSDPVESDDDLITPDPDVLRELATELKTGEHSRTHDDEDFDWEDMEWEPDPIDAAPEYMKSKNTDVIGNLISLFESKEVFVKELQTALADRLLKNKADFDQEISVLEHLKIRFGDSALQSCEVMLRDVLDSRKVDGVIRRDQGKLTQKLKPETQGIQLHAKILSRLFWPAISDQIFKIPSLVLKEQRDYERGFESLKQSRKLTWLNSVGQVEVQLELEDRTFSEEVLPWQASIIYAFNGNASQSVSRSITQLASSLEMSPTLVRSACIFWVSKRILIETDDDTFTVLEKLPEGDDSLLEPMGRDDLGAAAAAEIVAGQAAKELEEKDRKEKMAMYHQFVVSMLTNQGAMPLPRIAMMLGIVVPGGFPFSNEELKEFLGGMVRDGILMLGHGGAYKIAS